jgi:hypothetical protein
MRHRIHVPDEDPRRLARGAPAHEIAVGKFGPMTDEELIARIRELNAQIMPMIELWPTLTARG